MVLFDFLNDIYFSSVIVFLFIELLSRDGENLSNVEDKINY
jgi:hypothetical protein